MAAPFLLHGGRPRAFFLFCRPFYRQNGPVETLRRWVPASRFEHSNRDLLALHTCRDMAVFVVHKVSLAVSVGSQGRPRGVPEGSPGVPGGSLGSLRGPGKICSVTGVRFVGPSLFVFQPQHVKKRQKS